MAIYRLEPTRDTLHGDFSRDLTPLLTIASGDTIHYRTLDAGWHLFDQPHPFEQGSRLFLPIAVDGGLFSLGDGHAVQGDGEVAGPALECPMEDVEVTFYLHEDLPLAQPRAETPVGWITFGFHDDLHAAMLMALNDMLDLVEQIYQVDRIEAVALASLLVDLRITQIVNGVRGVHAILPDPEKDGGR